MDKVKLAELFAHEKWANKELVKAAGDQPSEKFIELMSHIIFAQNIWITRLKGDRNTTHPRDTIEPSKIAERIQDNYEDLLQLVKLMELNSTVKYRNAKGQEFSNSAIDILIHLLLHSQYHRGQIASEMSSRGIEVPGTDYVVYKNHSISY